MLVLKRDYSQQEQKKKKKAKKNVQKTKRDS